MAETLISNSANYSYTFGGTSVSLLETEVISKYDISPADYVTVTKTADVENVIKGMTVTYTITIVVADVPIEFDKQVLVDTYDKTELSLIEGTTTLDGVPTTIDLSGYTTNFENNSTHVITYQCLVL